MEHHEENQGPVQLGQDKSVKSLQEIKMLPKSVQSNVALSCYAIVANRFAEFHNPKYRGSKFNWDNFPEMMKSSCANGIFLNVNIPEKHTEAAKIHASDIGFKIAEQLIKLMKE